MNTSAHHSQKSDRLTTEIAISCKPRTLKIVSEVIIRNHTLHLSITRNVLFYYLWRLGLPSAQYRRKKYLLCEISVKEFRIYSSAVRCRGCQQFISWVLVSSPGIANELGGITLIPISMNLGQAPKIEAQDPCHPQVNQDQEVHLSSGNKPKRTGSLALFYRKVSCDRKVWLTSAVVLKLHAVHYLSVFTCLAFGLKNSLIAGRREKLL